MAPHIHMLYALMEKDSYVNQDDDSIIWLMSTFNILMMSSHLTTSSNKPLKFISKSKIPTHIWLTSKVSFEANRQMLKGLFQYMSFKIRFSYLQE